jgi:hypothetical protein
MPRQPGAACAFNRLTVAGWPSPLRLCPPDLADALRQNKRAILDLLEAEAKSLPADCAPWLHVARQVLAGEFEGADRSTVASLSIGLRRIQHSRCRQALARLQHAAKV